MRDVAATAAATATATPTTFPILTLDEARLAPGWGYVFDPAWLDPCESFVSMLWKFAVMNGLAGHQVVGHAARRPVDPYEGFPATAAEVDVPGITHSLGVPPETLRVALHRPGWPRGWCSQLRFCPRCMARGYHSILHQYGSEPQCPLHGTWLESECAGCGAASAYHLDARLLDAPFRCAQCRRPYGRTAASFVKRQPLPKRARMVLVRTFAGTGMSPPLRKAARR